MGDTETWELIHTERATMADTLEALSPEQWSTPSLCGGWTVQMTAGHIVVGAEQTTPHFAKGMATSGFRFDTMTDREAHQVGARPPTEIVQRLRARTTTTNRPPAPVAAMLGEIVVHGEDIRRPLGIDGTVDDRSVTACLEMFSGANFPVGAKKRMAGLRVTATDLDWSHGDGPEVAGPGLALLMAVTGRAAGLDDLQGDGVDVLRGRVRGS
jgi:uncharacterized protein (TIGR03083 family)